jgi:hypothetical protein
MTVLDKNSVKNDMDVDVKQKPPAGPAKKSQGSVHALRVRKR